MHFGVTLFHCTICFAAQKVSAAAAEKLLVQKLLEPQLHVHKKVQTQQTEQAGPHMCLLSRNMLKQKREACLMDSPMPDLNGIPMSISIMLVF